MKNLRKLSRLLLSTLIITFSFAFILLISVGLFFSNYKEQATNDIKSGFQLSVNHYSNQIKDAMLLLDKKKIEDLYIEILNINPYIKNLQISNPRFIFNENTLFHHTKNFNDHSWLLLDVQADIYYGEIKKIENSSYYEFIPSSNFDKEQNIAIRYQLLKNGVIKNLVVGIDLNIMDINKVKSTKIEDDYPFWFHIFYTAVEENFTENLKLNDLNLITLNYTIDDKLLKDNLYKIIVKLFFLVFIIFVPSILGLVSLLKFLERKYIKKPMEYLNTLTQHTLEYKFVNIDKKVFNNIEEFDDVIKNFKKLSTNIANLKNELNINKEMMERSTQLDNLTGLYDKKLFDLDMKAMFVSSYHGYILCLRISKLNEIAESLGFLATDNFLISFVNCVNDVIHDSPKTNNLTFYRFQGSEFVMIAKDLSYEEVYKLSEDIVKNVTQELFKNYKLPENIFHLGVVPFDLYGTTDSILKMGYGALNRAIEKNENTFEIVSEDELNKEAIELENSVKEVVLNSSFTFDFVLDSFLYDNDKLIMRELRPILLDNNNKFLPIGAFIAACEKLELNVDFDKDVTMKALNYIKENSVDYKIAVNLSVRTIANFEFLQFVENLVQTQKEYINKIVFSVTSYTASAFNMEFIRFVSFMNELDLEILVKRYKPKDYPIENLSKLGISYIRIDRDLTQNIHQDLMKKHKVKNIAVYSQLNGIKVLTDSVESKKDYDLLSRLDLYATSK